ncbi:hypothetical protein HZC20_03320 [Candidatus Peregrinibacteria bacterium]|nr:hypothetical protein [Candidatus Peregrinibacteria bacterium]
MCFVADKITDAVRLRGLLKWTFKDIGRIDMGILRSLWCADNAVGVSAGISGCLKYLPNDILLSFETDYHVMRYRVLAERVMRDLNGSSLVGWKISDIKDRKLMDELKELNGKIDLVLASMANEARYSFIADSHVVDRGKAVIGNVSANGVDDVVPIDKILIETGYMRTGVVSFDLMDRLRAEVVKGNKYALTIAESVIDFVLTSSGVGFSIVSRNVAEILFRVNRDDGDLYRQICKLAYCLCGNSHEVSLDDVSFGDGGSEGLSLGKRIGIY